MRKFLSIISAFAVVVPSALSVVACGPTIPENVILLLPGISMSTNSLITVAYRDAVNNFNEEVLKDSSVKIEARWEADNPISRRIRPDSGEVLPDLYVAYPDIVSQFVYNLNSSDSVRNMEDTYFGNETTAEQHEELLNKFWSANFYEEGVIKEDLYVLPVNKSFDMNAVNLKLFVELVSLVDKDLADKISEGLINQGHSGQASKLFDHTKNVTLDQGSVDYLKKVLSVVNDSNDMELTIREFFKLNANVYHLAVIYNNYFVQGAFGEDLRFVNDPRKMYPIAIDSMSNKIFMEYADALGTGKIDPTHKDTTDFFYQFNGYDEQRGTMTVTLDKPDSPIFKDITAYFNDLTQLARRNNKSNDADTNIKWGGSLYNKYTANLYGSNLFAEGSTLINSLSSAGTWAMKANQDKDKIAAYDNTKDLLAVSASTSKGNYFNFVQQGPGIAGFKSIGKNAAQKEEVVTKFVNYLLEPKVQNRLSILSGYIPSTTDALDIFKHYKNGDYNNETGEWTVEKPVGIVDDNFEQIIQLAGIDKGKAMTQVDILVDQLLTKFFGEMGPEQTHIVSTVANPAGGIIRSAFDVKPSGFIFKNLDDFAHLLRNDQRDIATVMNYVATNLPDGFSNNSVVKIKS